MAAEGYARIENKPAIVNVTSGPEALMRLMVFLVHLLIQYQ